MWESIRQKTDVRVKFIHLLSKFLLSIDYAPSTIVGNDSTAMEDKKIYYSTRGEIRFGGKR